jgi:hypothetical protein
MRKHGIGVCVLLALAACSQDGAAVSSNQASPDATTVAAQSDGKQYRAVCLEAAAHGGNPSVLSRWLDVKDKAVSLGQYHGDFKEKGHRWVLEERARPAQTTP